MAASTLSFDGDLAHLDLAGPLDPALVARLDDACATVADRPALRALVLTAAADTWAGWAAAVREAPDALGLIGDPFAPLATLTLPTIAALEGPVRDGGLELALCADLRVAAADCSFALAPDGPDAFPIAGGIQRLTRVVGRARTLELVLLGAPIDAATALQWGLVSALSSDPRAAAFTLARRLAEHGPLATRLAKEAVRRGLEMPLEQALRYETDLTVLLQTTADRAEGVRAFLDKRPPRFQGR